MTLAEEFPSLHEQFQLTTQAAGSVAVVGAFEAYLTEQNAGGQHLPEWVPTD